MSSIIKKPNKNCISCKILLNDKNKVKNRKNVKKCLNNIRNENKKQITNHVFENNTMTKTEKTLIIGRSG